MRIQPIAMPRTGATRMNEAILMSSAEFTAAVPALATAAPAGAAMGACDELVGNARYHGMRSHAMAPTRPAVTTGSVFASGLTIALPIVSATFVSNTLNATKLKNAAQSTAW